VVFQSFAFSDVAPILRRKIQGDLIHFDSRLSWVFRPEFRIPLRFRYDSDGWRRNIGSGPEPENIYARFSRDRNSDSIPVPVVPRWKRSTRTNHEDTYDVQHDVRAAEAAAAATTTRKNNLQHNIIKHQPSSIIDDVHETTKRLVKQPKAFWKKRRHHWIEEVKGWRMIQTTIVSGLFDFYFIFGILHHNYQPWWLLEDILPPPLTRASLRMTPLAMKKLSQVLLRHVISLRAPGQVSSCSSITLA